MADLPNDGDLNWGGPVRTYMEETRTISASASAAANTASAVADEALALAELSVAPTDSAVAGLAGSPTSALSTALYTSYDDGAAIPFNAKRYGAIGDGVADDATAITAAIAAGISFGINKIVFLPAGTYKLGSAVTVPTGVSIHATPGTVTLTWSGARSAFNLNAGSKDNTFYGLRFLGSMPVNKIGTTLEQVGINCLAATSTTPITGLFVERCTFEKIEGCGVRIKHITDFNFVRNTFKLYGYAGIGLYSPLRGLIDGNSFTGTNALPAYSGNTYAAFASVYEPDGDINGPTTPRPQSVRFSNNFVEDQAWEGLDTHIGKGISFIGNQFLNCSGNAIAAVGVGAGSPLGCPDALIAHNIITGPTGPNGTARMGIVLRGQPTGIAGAERCTGTITGNVIKWVGDDVSTVSGGIVVANGLGVAVTGNVMIECRSAGIVLQDSPGTTGTGNVVRDVWRSSGTATAILITLVADASTTVTLTANKLIRGSLTAGTDVPAGAQINTAGYAGTNTNAVSVEQEGNFFPTGTAFSGNMRHIRSGTRGTVEVDGTAAPTSGTWTTGDRIKNVGTLASGQYIGWICRSGGTPGTWAGFGLIA